MNNSTGPRDRPSPAWGLVENRPALFRRRRPGTQRGRWVWARRAVGDALPHASVPVRPRRPETGWPAGPAGSGRPRGPQFVCEFLTQDTSGRILANRQAAQVEYGVLRGGAATAALLSFLTAVLVGLGLIWAPGVAAATADPAILLLFPKPEEARPWVSEGPAQLAEGQELFALIDGGAELFLRHGFERAAVQSYTFAGGRHIQVEIYMMRSVDGAADVFARKTGPGELPLALGDAGAGGEYYIVFRRGRFLVTVTAGDADADAKAAVLRIARAVENRIIARCP